MLFVCNVYMTQTFILILSDIMGLDLKIFDWFLGVLNNNNCVFINCNDMAKHKLFNKYKYFWAYLKSSKRYNHSLLSKFILF